MSANVEYPRLIKSIIIILISMMLTACADGSRREAVREELRDGLRIIHNLKNPAEIPFRDLASPEEVVIGGEESGEDDLLVRPAGITADAAGNIYVLDSRDCTVKKFGPDGAFRTRIGRKGQGPGEFESPWGLAIDEEGILYVRDLMAAKIEIFDAQGAPRTSVRGKMWSDFVPVGGGKAVFEYSATVGEESAAKRILRLAAGTLEKEKSILFSREQLPFRSVQNKDFRFDIPLYVRWAVAPGGRIYLGTADRYEIRVMTFDGKSVFAFSRDYERIPVPANIQAAILKQVGASKLPMMVVDARDFEDHIRYYPVFKSIAADERGRIWVEIYQAEQGAAAPEGTLFDVFSAEGILLFSTRIESNLTFRPVFKNGCCYALRLDGKGFPQAVRWRLR